MARLPVADIETLDEAARANLLAAEKMLGFSPNDGLLMAHNLPLMQAFLKLVQTIYAPGKVSQELKRLLGLITSAAAGCQYCQAHTTFSAHRLGVSEEKLRDVWTFAESALYNDAERAALTVALKAGQSPNGVTDQDFAALGEHFDLDAQLEIVAVISMFGFLNRWNSTLATDLEAAPAALWTQVER
ncbi:MAG: carboxymuconolactone decarboxylase family protein [Pseudomonadota bacterium]